MNGLPNSIFHPSGCGPAVGRGRSRCGFPAGIYLVLTPEEWVRQHLIACLVTCCGAQPTRIVQEYAVPLNGQPQRADVVVVDDSARPLLLAECKAPHVKIDGRTLPRPFGTIRCWRRATWC